MFAAVVEGDNRAVGTGIDIADHAEVLGRRWAEGGDGMQTGWADASITSPHGAIESITIAAVARFK